MIQTHAYDAWVELGARASVAFRVTRELGSIPAPIFVFLAGVGVAYGEVTMARRGALPNAIRARFARRGGEILLLAYVVSAVYAWMDGAQGFREILRADILHAIALTLIVLALVVVQRRHALWTAAGLSAIALAGSLALTGWAKSTLAGHALAPIFALFVEVPPYSRFPLMPTLAFAGLGYVFGRRILASPLKPGQALAICGLSALVALVANVATKQWVDAAELGPLTRGHPALLLNFIDGTARALSVTALAVWVSPRLPDRVSSVLVRLGQGSLWAYAFHIPFCYGRVGRALWHALGMTNATLCVASLMALTWLAVFARDVLRDRWKKTRTAGT